MFRLNASLAKSLTTENNKFLIWIIYIRDNTFCFFHDSGSKRRKYIGKSIKTLLNQTYPINKYEVLIIDGVSIDKAMDSERKG